MLDEPKKTLDFSGLTSGQVGGLGPAVFAPAYPIAPEAIPGSVLDRLYKAAQEGRETGTLIVRQADLALIFELLAESEKRPLDEVAYRQAYAKVVGHG